jgi:hypothetical protein
MQAKSWVLHGSFTLAQKISEIWLFKFKFHFHVTKVCEQSDHSQHTVFNKKEKMDADCQ